MYAENFCTSFCLTLYRTSFPRFENKIPSRGDRNQRHVSYQTGKAAVRENFDRLECNTTCNTETNLASCGNRSQKTTCT